jgi:hypothetical protein
VEYKDYFDSIKDKELNELSLNELAFVHLNGSDWNEIKRGILHSVLPIVIREIRHAKLQTYSQNFLPLAAAFTVLDQIGFCYSRNDMAPYSSANASSIKKSLYYFCGFGDNDENTKALYALRNSFLHTSSLLSKGERDNQPNYSFVFDRSSETMIKAADIAWDGDFNNMQPNMSTVVNPNLVVDMVEETVKKALELLFNNKLVVSCAGGGAEFYYRFLKMSQK